MSKEYLEAIDLETQLLKSKGIETETPEPTAKEQALDILNGYLEKAGPYIGPRGGKYADPQHKIPWKEEKHGKKKETKEIDDPELAGVKTYEEARKIYKKRHAYEMKLIDRPDISHPRTMDAAKRAAAKTNRALRLMHKIEAEEEAKKSMEPTPTTRHTRVYDDRRPTVMPGDQREAMAYENARLARRLQKGESVTIDPRPRANQPQSEAMAPKEPNIRTQGSRSMVAYHMDADDRYAEFAKSRGVTDSGQTPTIAKDNMLVRDKRQCPSCQATLIKALTVCPDCGHGGQPIRIINTMAGEHSSAPDRRGPRLRPQPQKSVVLLSDDD